MKQEDNGNSAFRKFVKFKWYVLEGERREDGDFEFYGIVVNQYGAERGYFALSQLESVIKWGVPVVERDLYFDACKVDELDIEW